MPAQIPETAERVSQQTALRVNQQIQFNTEAAVLHFAQRIDEIQARLTQLQHEWDIERALQTSAGLVISTSLVLGLFKKRWRALSMLAAGFLLMHGIQGWCPPLPIFRRLGVRTQREINREKYALRAIRGDFAGLDPRAPGQPHEKAKLAAGAVSQKFSPIEAEDIFASQTLSVP